MNFHDLVCSSIFHRVFTNLYIEWIQFFYKSELFVHLIMYTIFHWIFTILYIQRILIFKQIHTICTFNVHNFSFNFHDFVVSIEIKFPKKSELSLHLLYTIFHWIIIVWFVHWFSIEFSRICRFNEFDFFFFYKPKRFVNLIYIIFHWILTILYFQQNQISQQVQTIRASNVHHFSLNFHASVRSLIFHWDFTNFSIKWIRFFYKSKLFVHLIMYTIFL